jgi:hypothetical protein
MTKNGEIVPFGKYRGQPIELMMADVDYCNWVLKQPGIRERYAAFIAIIVNGGSAPDAETPEHNRMQALFLDQEMCVAAVRAIIGDDVIAEHIKRCLAGFCDGKYEDKDIERARLEAVAQFDDAKRSIEEERDRPRPLERPLKLYCDMTQEERKTFDAERDAAWKRRRSFDDKLSALEETIKEAGRKAAKARIVERIATGQDHEKLYATFSAQFEVNGWDVAVIPWQNLYGRDECCCIELKPVLGDDYPAVLRTIKGRCNQVRAAALIVDHFDAEGATYDQVKRMFKASDVEVRMLAEVKAMIRGAS